MLRAKRRHPAAARRLAGRLDEHRDAGARQRGARVEAARAPQAFPDVIRAHDPVVARVALDHAVVALVKRRDDHVDVHAGVKPNLERHGGPVGIGHNSVVLVLQHHRELKVARAARASSVRGHHVHVVRKPEPTQEHFLEGQGVAQVNVAVAVHVKLQELVGSQTRRLRAVAGPWRAVVAARAVGVRSTRGKLRRKVKENKPRIAGQQLAVFVRVAEQGAVGMPAAAVHVRQRAERHAPRRDARPPRPKRTR